MGLGFLDRVTVQRIRMLSNLMLVTLMSGCAGVIDATISSSGGPNDAAIITQKGYLVSASIEDEMLDGNCVEIELSASRIDGIAVASDEVVQVNLSADASDGALFNDLYCQEAFSSETVSFDAGNAIKKVYFAPVLGLESVVYPEPEFLWTMSESVADAQKAAEFGQIRVSLSDVEAEQAAVTLQAPVNLGPYFGVKASLGRGCAASRSKLQCWGLGTGHTLRGTATSVSGRRFLGSRQLRRSIVSASDLSLNFIKHFGVGSSQLVCASDHHKVTCFGGAAYYMLKASNAELLTANSSHVDDLVTFDFGSDTIEDLQVSFLAACVRLASGKAQCAGFPPQVFADFNTSITVFTRTMQLIKEQVQYDQIDSDVNNPFIEMALEQAPLWQPGVTDRMIGFQNISFTGDVGSEIWTEKVHLIALSPFTMCAVVGDDGSRRFECAGFVNRTDVARYTKPIASKQACDDLWTTPVTDGTTGNRLKDSLAQDMCFGELVIDSTIDANNQIYDLSNLFDAESIVELGVSNNSSAARLIWMKQSNGQTKWIGPSPFNQQTTQSVRGDDAYPPTVWLRFSNIPGKKCAHVDTQTELRCFDENDPITALDACGLLGVGSNCDQAATRFQSSGPDSKALDRDGNELNDIAQIQITKDDGRGCAMVNQGLYCGGGNVGTFGWVGSGDPDVSSGIHRYYQSPFGGYADHLGAGSGVTGVAVDPWQTCVLLKGQLSCLGFVPTVAPGDAATYATSYQIGDGVLFDASAALTAISDKFDEWSNSVN
jgi:hypothetical protein